MPKFQAQKAHTRFHVPPELRSVVPLYPRTSMRHLWFSCASTRLQLISRVHTYQKKKPWPSWIFNFDQKVKILKTNLSHSIFWVNSDFGIRFFIWNLEIVQTGPISKKLTFA